MRRIKKKLSILLLVFVFLFSLNIVILYKVFSVDAAAIMKLFIYDSKPQCIIEEKTKEKEVEVISASDMSLQETRSSNGVFAGIGLRDKIAAFTALTKLEKEDVNRILGMISNKLTDKECDEIESILKEKLGGAAVEKLKEMIYGG